MRKSECKLLYTSTQIDDKGSAHIVQTEKLIACDDRGLFNHRYYDDAGRSMRQSVNLNIPTYYVTENLQQVEYQGRKYDIKKILPFKENDRYSILDCQEVLK